MWETGSKRSPRWLVWALAAAACGGQTATSGGSSGDGGASAVGGTAGASMGNGGGASDGGSGHGWTGGRSATGGASSGGTGGTGGSDTGGSAGDSNMGGESSGDGGDGGDATGGTGTGGAATGGTGTGGVSGCLSCLDADCGECPDEPMVYVADGDYWIDATEVTNAQYAEFVAAGASLSIQPAECSFNGSYVPTNQWPATDRAGEPVAWVDWCDAYAYCAWAGKRLCGAIDGGPTPYASFKNASVSQWYNACSAGGTLVYPYGADYDADACNGGDGIRDPWVAGSEASCQGGYEGLFDMSGNLWEWEDSCASSDGQSDFCRARGGSFWSSSTSMRCQGATTEHVRSQVNRNLGFRCCADAEEN